MDGTPASFVEVAFGIEAADPPESDDVTSDTDTMLNCVDVPSTCGLVHEAVVTHNKVPKPLEVLALEKIGLAMDHTKAVAEDMNDVFVHYT